jgi:putative Mg2+ transporter-C (MgtC) family protein
MTVISNAEVVIRLLAITLIAGFIGLEREYYGKPAGLRTNIMVGLGATLMTIASIKAVELFPEMKALDPTRIAAQIITGIGFIGAGAILRPANNSNTSGVIGLTTAATMWVVCGMGIAIGMGFYFEALVTTGLVFFTFVVLSAPVRWIRDYSKKNLPHWYTEHDDH